MKLHILDDELLEIVFHKVNTLGILLLKLTNSRILYVINNLKNCARDATTEYDSYNANVRLLKCIRLKKQQGKLINSFIYNNYYEGMVFLKDEGFKFYGSDFVKAIEYERLKMLDLFDHKLIRSMVTSHYYAAITNFQKSRDFTILRWLCENGYKPNKYAVAAAAQYDDVGLIKWLLKRGGVVNKEAIKRAMEYYSIKTLRLFEMMGEFSDCDLDQDFIMMIIESKNLKTAKWFYNKGVRFLTSKFHGRIIEICPLDFVKWALKETMPLCNNVINLSIQNKDIEVTKYLYGLGYTHNDRTIVLAAFESNKKAMDLVVEKGYIPTSENLISVINDKNEFKYVKWFFDYGFHMTNYYANSLINNYWFSGLKPLFDEVDFKMVINKFKITDKRDMKVIKYFHKNEHKIKQIKIEILLDKEDLIFIAKNFDIEGVVLEISG